MRFGAIDIGTNAARLLIGEVVKEGDHSFVKKINYTRIPLRLGLEVFENGMISPGKAHEFIQAMQAFSLIAKMFAVQDIRACATSAMREAVNGKTIAEEIFKVTQIPVEIISGEEEARLIFGTFFLLDFDKSQPFMVIDVGGGSTEINVFENGERIAASSFQVGTIRLLKGKVNPKIWKDIKAWIAVNVDLQTDHRIFVTGGNINKIHKMIGKHPDEIKVVKLVELRRKLEKLTVPEREDIYQLKPDRADVIVPACLIFEFIFKQIKAKKVFAPKIGLSDGMIYDMYLRHQKVD